MPARLASALILLAFVSLTGMATAQGEDWPGWRGPRGDGSSQEKNIPLEWNAAENAPPTEWKNIAWRTPLPGIGHSSPIVYQDRILTNTADTEKQDRVLVALDRK
jgi:outer membrane protein assembly factor BamB